LSNFILNTKANAGPDADAPVWRRVQNWLQTKAIAEQFLNTPGYVFYVTVAIMFGLLASYGGLTLSIAAIVALVGIPVMIGCVFNLRFGVLLLFVLMFTALHIKRMIPAVPVGISFDAVTAALVFGLLVHQTRHRDWSFLKTPVSYGVLLWLLYTAILFFNPNAASRMAYIYTVRSFAGLMVFYFILLYTINNMKFVKQLIFVWLFFGFLGALYGLFQDYIGLRQWEWDWLLQDYERFRRYAQFGNIKKWSFFSDPMVFGILCSISGVATLFLLGIFKNIYLKILIVIAAVLFFMAMITSGTRASYVLPAGALGFYILMQGSTRTILLSVAAGIVAVSVIYMPTSNQRLIQFQSAFKPAEDASFEVRERNQAFIQPYIQANPLGGGLGSTGAWGQRFTPNSFLAQFPPDSGFVRTAVEAGWVGLLLYCLLLSLVMYEAIRNYFRIRDPVLRHYQLMFMTVLLMLIVANFPQEAINSPPINAIFYLCIAAISKLREFDVVPELQE
jgi:O-antigen ligase